MSKGHDDFSDSRVETLGGDMEVDPMGIGVSIFGPGICSAGMGNLLNVATYAHDFTHNTINKEWDLSLESGCDTPWKIIRQVYCDTNCIRDAVIRGDATINKNMEIAERAIQKNMKELATWNAKTTETQAAWLGDINRIGLTHLSKLIGQVYTTMCTNEACTSSLVDVSNGMDILVGEMQQYASRSAFDRQSKFSAVRALRHFAESTVKLESQEPNATLMNKFAGDMLKLHGTLKAAGSRSMKDASNAFLFTNAEQVQTKLRTEFKSLGIYKRHSQNAQASVRHWSAQRSVGQSVLIELDKVWWHLRGKLDGYLDKEDVHIKAIELAVRALQDYHQCTVGFSSLLPMYHQAADARAVATEHLQTTWREGSNLLGELAAIIVDGEIFNVFISKEGCRSELAAQTLMQYHAAASGMTILSQRFGASGLGRPDLSELESAAKRIASNYAAARSHCK